jgi:hypothetical protein
VLEDLIDAARSARTVSNDDRFKLEALLMQVAKFVVSVTPDHIEPFGRSNGQAVLATMPARLVVTDPGRADQLLAGVSRQWDRLTVVAMTDRAVVGARALRLPKTSAVLLRRYTR